MKIEKKIENAPDFLFLRFSNSFSNKCLNKKHLFIILHQLLHKNILYSSTIFDIFCYSYSIIISFTFLQMDIAISRLKRSKMITRRTRTLRYFPTSIICIFVEKATDFILKPRDKRYIKTTN